MAFTVANVEDAIQKFYSGNSLQAGADQWLTAAQISPEAWTFCWDLLSPNKQPEIQFFGANTLQVKITKFWHELPEDQYEMLRRKLVEFVVTYAAGPRIILNRLCIALASYVIHTIYEHWSNAIPDIISALQPQNCSNLSESQNVNILLEILTVIPEEFDTMLMPRTHRGLVREKLKDGALSVLPYLHQIVLYSTLVESRQHAIKCFSCWINLGIPLPGCEGLVSLVMESTGNDELCDEALDCLTNVACYQGYENYTTSLKKLIGQILRLDGLLARSVQEGDADRCYNLCFLFTNLGEAHSRLIVEGVLDAGEFREHAAHLVRLILQCTATPGQYPVNEICSGLVFNFWYLLQEDIVASDPDKYADYLAYFLPVYTSLVDILLTKCVFPSDDQYCLWNLDQKERFRCYRQDIADTLIYCYNVLQEPLIQMLYSHLQTVLAKMDSEQNSWQFVEACLFALESVAENVDIEMETCLPQFFVTLAAIPFANIRVTNAALSVIGAYAEWIHFHPDVLAHVLPLLTLGLQNKVTAPSATRALKEISRDCQQHMGPFADKILAESQRTMSSGILDSAECVRLICSIGRLLSIMELSHTLNYLDNLLTPYIQELKFLTGQPQTPHSQSRSVVLIDMLAMLFANLDVKMQTPRDDLADEGESEFRFSQTQHRRCSTPEKTAPGGTEVVQPVLVVLQQILPIIRDVSLLWSGNGTVIESVCDALKKAVSTLLDDCLPILPDVLDLMNIVYQNQPRSAILDLAKQFLLLFGKNPDQAPLLRSVFVNITRVTLHLCENALAEHTDLVQGFLQVLAQVLKKNSAFLQHPDFDLGTLFRFGIAAISLPESSTVKAAASFLVTFVTHSCDVDVLSRVVHEQGEPLVEQSLRCIGESPRGVIDQMADILHVLNKVYFQMLCRWMTSIMQREGVLPPRVTAAQKEHYIRMILTLEEMLKAAAESTH